MLNAYHWRLQAHVVRTVVDQPAALDQRIKCRLQNGREIVSVTAASNWKCPRWADDDQPVMHVRKTLHPCFGPYPLLHLFHSAMTSHVVCPAIWRERQGNFWQRKRHQLQPGGRHATSSPNRSAWCRLRFGGFCTAGSGFINKMSCHASHRASIASASARPTSLATARHTSCWTGAALAKCDVRWG